MRTESALPQYGFAYQAEPTIGRFHYSEAFIRGIRGPWGSGKSVGCVMEMLRRATEQKPDRYKKRKTRWIAVRNTYGELKTTTIKTWQEWVPPELAPMKFDEPISCRLVRTLDDGTTMDMEVFFVSMDRPASINKVRGMDVTGAWINEASEMDKSVLDILTARVGRYPAKKDGAPYTWCGVLMDTNSMEDDHWWHDLDVGPIDEDAVAEINTLMKGLKYALEQLGIDRPLIEFFDQPPALIEAQGSYVPNPDAENVKGQPLGHAYWLQLCAGKAKEWIDIFVLNQYGKVIDGKPVYPEYNNEIHGRALMLRPIPGLPITIGLDFGLSPAAVPCQVTAKGQLLILGECVAKERSMGFTQFYSQALKPYLANKFGSTDENGAPWKFVPIGDPAGGQRAQGDEQTIYQIAEDLNWPITPAKTNSFIARREALAWFMNRLVEGHSAMLIDSSARMIRKGLKGGYHYRRVQVTGEARYMDEPYKNKFSHPVEGAQYAAMEYVAIESPMSHGKDVSAFQRRLNASSGVQGQPWRRRGGRLPGTGARRFH